MSFQLTRLLCNTRVGIRAPSAPLFAELSWLTAALPSVPPDTPLDIVYHVEQTDRGYRLIRGGAAEEGLSREEVFRALVVDLAFRAARKARFVLLHAAAVVKDGRVVLLPGPSGSGKTTLAAFLLKRGYCYLSEDLTPLSLDLTARPFPFPLRLREGALRLLAPLAPELTLWPTSFWAWGEQVWYALPGSWHHPLEAEAPVGLIVFPRLRSDGPTEARKLKPGLAALKLMTQTVNRDLLGDKGFGVAADLVHDVPCYDLLVGEAAEAAELIESLNTCERLSSRLALPRDASISRDGSGGRGHPTVRSFPQLGTSLSCQEGQLALDPRGAGTCGQTTLARTEA